MKYNGVDLKQLYGVRLTDVQGRADMPESQEDEEEIPGSENIVTIGSPQPKLKTITAVLDISTADTWDQLKANETQIRKALFNKGFCPIVFADRPTVQWLAQVREFSLPEEKYLVSEATIVFDAFALCLDVTPATITISGGIGAQQRSVNNTGDVTAYPLYTVTFSSNVLEYTLACGNGSGIRLQNLSSADTLIIDTVKERVLRNGIDVTGSLLSTEFPVIPTGQHTIYTWGKPSNYPLSHNNYAHVVAQYRQRYL